MDLNPRNFGYSMKNIPLPNNTAYLKVLTTKIEALIRRMRWKVYHFENPGSSENNENQRYGFKTPYAPPKHQLLDKFEQDLCTMIKNVKFCQVENDFLRKLNNDVTAIKESDNVLVFADKSTNIYDVTPNRYMNILKDNITKDYRKCNEDKAMIIDKEAKKIASDLKLHDRVQRMTRKNAFITLKDHKENFSHNLKCRLINPAKSEIGIISKQILDNVNEEVRRLNKSLQWKNTSSVIAWFDSINEKRKCKFIKFDVVNFYPSITEELLLRSLMFAKSLTKISDQEIHIIQHSCKSLLFNEDSVWEKKGNSGLFDITMGSFQGAEACETVGLYLLDKLRRRFGVENMGLYRDDGLGILRNASGPQADKARKDLIRIFKDEKLQVTVETNLTATDFLDVTFDLASSKYFPYRKPNNEILYVNKESNHPPSVIKQIPQSINRRISDISCNEYEFDKAKPVYEKALKESGYDVSMKYSESVKKTRKRQRKVIWFNPPFSVNVKTRLGQLFFNILDKNFPINHKFHRLFNRSNVKLSYSCMPNMGRIIKSHNEKILQQQNQEETPDNRSCNCMRPSECPLSGNCLVKNIIYKATISSPGTTNKHYYGASATTFKLRYTDHKSSFNHEKYKNKSQLSKYIWYLKSKKKTFNIVWSIYRKAKPCIKGSNYCDLCTTEKLVIAKSDSRFCLNKKSEIVSTCRHKKKFYLSSV